MIKLSKSEEEEIRREDKSKIDWLDISKNFIFQEDFIREFQNEFDWVYISYYQILSEEFIKEFQGKVDWRYICQRQKLSEKFICNLLTNDEFLYFYDCAIINSKNLTTNLINHPALNKQINFNRIALCYFRYLSHPNKWKTFL